MPEVVKSDLRDSSTSKKPVLNRDLWEKLLELSKRHDIEWVWVRGQRGPF